MLVFLDPVHRVSEVPDESAEPRRLRPQLPASILVRVAVQLRLPYLRN